MLNIIANIISHMTNETQSDENEADISGFGIEEAVLVRYETLDGQIVNPGLSKKAWDKVLVRSGFDPSDMVEYNLR